MKEDVIEERAVDDKLSNKLLYLNEIVEKMKTRYLKEKGILEQLQNDYKKINEERYFIKATQKCIFKSIKVNSMVQYNYERIRELAWTHERELNMLRIENQKLRGEISYYSNNVSQRVIRQRNMTGRNMPPVLTTNDIRKMRLPSLHDND